mgnify:CR=1 FL=1
MKKIPIALPILLISLLLYVSLRNDIQRTKDFKTAEEWALEGAKEYFFYNRESDEVYLYTIDELYIDNYNEKYVRAFKVVMMDDYWQSESYYVVIKYNKDNHFKTIFKRLLGLIKEEKFGIEHIVWADVDEM